MPLSTTIFAGVRYEHLCIYKTTQPNTSKWLLLNQCQNQPFYLPVCVFVRGKLIIRLLDSYAVWYKYRSYLKKLYLFHVNWFVNKNVCIWRITTNICFILYQFRLSRNGGIKCKYSSFRLYLSILTRYLPNFYYLLPSSYRIL